LEGTVRRDIESIGLAVPEDEEQDA